MGYTIDTNGGQTWDGKEGGGYSGSTPSPEGKAIADYGTKPDAKYVIDKNGKETSNYTQGNQTFGVGKNSIFDPLGKDYNQLVANSGGKLTLSDLDSGSANGISSYYNGNAGSGLTNNPDYIKNMNATFGNDWQDSWNSNKTGIQNYGDPSNNPTKHSKSDRSELTSTPSIIPSGSGVPSIISPSVFNPETLFSQAQGALQTHIDGLHSSFLSGGGQLNPLPNQVKNTTLNPVKPVKSTMYSPIVNNTNNNLKTTAINKYVSDMWSKK